MQLHCSCINGFSLQRLCFAVQAAWQALLPSLQRHKPSFVVVQSSANHRTASAAVRLIRAQLKVRMSLHWHTLLG